MRRIKVIFIFVIFLVILNICGCVYADEEIEDEDITAEEIGEILETAAVVESEPTINSRHAIIYDRTSRKYIIWQI